MKRCACWIIVGLLVLIGVQTFEVAALMEEDQTAIYKVIHHSAAGDLESFTAYSLAGLTNAGYWLQRTVHMQRPETQPLSITQNLLDAASHQPLRYIKYRPAKMGRPANAIDLPLEEMGKDEIFPTPVSDAFKDAGNLDVPAGVFAAQVAEVGKFTIWINPDVPVLGVVKVEAPDWTMELFRIEPQAADLLPNKPPKGGMAYVDEE